MLPVNHLIVPDDNNEIDVGSRGAALTRTTLRPTLTSTTFSFTTNTPTNTPFDATQLPQAKENQKMFIIIISSLSALLFISFLLILILLRKRRLHRWTRQKEKRQEFESTLKRNMQVLSAKSPLESDTIEYIQPPQLIHALNSNNNPTNSILPLTGENIRDSDAASEFSWSNLPVFEAHFTLGKAVPVKQELLKD